MNVSDIVQYLNYFDAALLILIGLFTLGGLIAGLKKSLISFVLLVCLLLILFTSLNLLSNIILDYNFNLTINGTEIVTIRGFITDEIIKNIPAEQAAILTENSEAYKLLMTLIVTSMRVVLTFVGSMLIIFIIEPVLRIFIKLLMAIFSEKTDKKPSKHHLLGAGVGFLKGVLVASMIFVPLGGLSSVIGELKTNLEPAQELQPMALTALPGDEELDDLFTIAEKIESLRVRQLISYTKYAFDKPLDLYVFDNAMSLTQESQTVALREDLIRVVEIGNVILKYIGDGQKFDIYAITPEDLTLIFDSLKEMKIISVALPAALEYAMAQPDVTDQLDKYGITKEDIEEIDWKADIYTFFDAAKQVILLGKIDEADLLNLDIEKVRVIVNTLSSTTILEKALPALLNYAIQDVNIRKYLGEEFAFNYSDVDFAAEMNNLVDIYDEVKTLNLTPEDLKNLDFKALLSEHYEELNKILESLTSSGIINQALPTLADSLLNENLPEELKNKFSIDGVDDLSAELSKMLEIVHGINELGIPFDSFDFKTLDPATLDQAKVLDLIDDIFDLQILNGNEEDLFRALFRQLQIADADTIDLSNINWDDEKTAIKNVLDKMVILVKEAGTANFDDFNTIIRNETNRTNLLNVVDEASKSEIMKQFMNKMAFDMLQKNMPVQFADMLNLSDLEPEYWRSEFEKLINIYLDVTDANLFSDGEVSITADLAERLIRNVFTLRMIDGHEETIFNELFKMIPVLEGYIPNYNGVNWDTEYEKVIDVIQALNIPELGGLNNFNFDTFVESTNTQNIENLLVAINHSQILRPMLPQLIDKALTAANLTEWKNPWLTDQLVNGSSMASLADWDLEIDQYTTIISESVSFDMTTFDPLNGTDDQINKLVTILHAMNRAQSIEMSEFLDILNKLTTGQFLSGIVFTAYPANEEQWNQEIDVIGNILKSVPDVSPISLSKYGEIGSVLNNMKTSAVFAPVMKDILTNSFNSFSPDYATYMNLDTIDVLSVDWVNELGIINQLSSDFTNLSGVTELTDRDGSDITAMMTTASSGVVSTQIFGKIINDELAAILGTNNPTDGLGNPVYDYRDQPVLHDNAANLGNLIDFGNTLRLLYADPENTTYGMEAGTQIKAFAVGPSATRPTFADTYFPAILAYADSTETSPLAGVDMLTVDYDQEGQWFIDFYQATPENLPAIMADISANSVLTKAILESLGL